MSIYREHAQNRSVGWSTWHLQWCTKYRYKIFGYENQRFTCKVLLHEAVQRHAIKLLDCEVDVDHVHVVVSLLLTMTPCYAVHILKGYTAKGLFLAFPKLRMFYPRGHLWSPGKFIGSIGHITLEKAKAYIEAHHAKDPSLESQLLSIAKESPGG